MNKMSWKQLAVVLVALSACTYTVEYLLFHDLQEIYVWFLGSLAFLPLQVLLVTLMLERAIEGREKKAKLEKLNVVIGAFFGEIGRPLLVEYSDADPRLGAIKKELIVRNEWTDRDFAAASGKLAMFDYGADIGKIDLMKLRKFLHERRNFMLRMMENPNLLEHESFTDLLRAVFHVIEELEARSDFAGLPKNDIAHIQADVNRAYRLLVLEWLAYMKYIKREYPYLFHLAIRQNPFDEAASVIVK